MRSGEISDRLPSNKRWYLKGVPTSAGARWTAIEVLRGIDNDDIVALPTGVGLHAVEYGFYA